MAAATEVLACHQMGRLGCYSSLDDRTYVVPVSYAYHDGALYFVSLTGRKIDYLREHPRGVCLEVDEVDDARNWNSVIVTGHYEELRGEERRSEETSGLFRAAAGPLRFALADGDIYREPEAAVIWRLKVEEITGRRERWDLREGFRYW